MLFSVKSRFFGLARLSRPQILNFTEKYPSEGLSGPRAPLAGLLTAWAGMGGRAQGCMARWQAAGGCIVAPAARPRPPRGQPATESCMRDMHDSFSQN